MAVKTKDRHLANNAPLGKSRELINQILILTRPRIIKEDGSQTKPGILGEGQPLYAFGNDLIACGKRIHASCYMASKIKIRNYETWQERTNHLRQALNNCDSILRQLDLCIYQYARESKKKRKSFEYCAKLAYDTKTIIYERLNRDKILYERYYKSA